MRIIIGTKKEQLELSGVKWIIADTCELRIHTDGDRAVIEEVKDDGKEI